MSKNDPCPLCGEMDFSWGKVKSSRRIRFVEYDVISWWGKKVDARRCNTCGNLQFFTEIPKPREKSKRKRGE